VATKTSETREHGASDAVFDKFFSDEMTKLLNSNMKSYKRLVDNDKLREKLKSALFGDVYSEFWLRNKEKKSQNTNLRNRTQKKKAKEDKATRIEFRRS
jgi:hypothetical protein